MALLKSDIREELRSGSCEQCGEHIPEEENHLISFCGGRFIILHPECRDYMWHATKWRRGKSPPYTISEGGQAITCNTCRRTSFNANDVAQRYCGCCHKFHERG